MPLLLLPALLLLLGHCLAAPTAAYDFGLNLPTRSGTSGTGAFLPGVYSVNYSSSQLQRMRRLGFTSIRLPVNIATANDAGTLTQMRALVEAVGGSAVICMFGTGNLTTHGTGRVDDMSAATDAWTKVHETFRTLPGVKYEVFNEPHGYVSPGCNSPPCGTPAQYVRDMREIIHGAGLPEERCILDALGWAQDPHGLVQLGWGGYVGYHFYPWFLETKPGESRSRDVYAKLFESQLSNFSQRVFVTEFGANLNAANRDYEMPSTSDDVNCLQGMDDAVTALRERGAGLAGAFHWHGWLNGDSFSFFEPGNKNGSAKVLKVLGDAAASQATAARHQAQEEQSRQVQLQVQQQYHHPQQQRRQQRQQQQQQQQQQQWVIDPGFCAFANMIRCRVDGLADVDAVRRNIESSLISIDTNEWTSLGVAPSSFARIMDHIRSAPCADNATQCTPFRPWFACTDGPVAAPRSHHLITNTTEVREWLIQRSEMY
jgi:hypothetical protein